MARTNVMKKVYINDDGSETSHATGKARTLEFRLTNGEIIEVDPADYSEDVQRAAMFHGFSQSGGDSAAGSAKAEGDPIDWAAEQISTKVSNWESGLWITQREAGAPRISMLLAAFEEAVTSAGKAFDSDKAQAKLVDEATGADYRKSVLANAAVKAVYDRMRREAAEAREVKSAEAAEGVTIDDLL